EVILVEAVPERELERVLEALSCDHRAARTAPLDDGIGDKRSAVDGEADVVRRDARLLQDQRDTADDPFLRGRGSGQNLSRKEALRGLDDDSRTGAPQMEHEPAHF